MNRLTVAEFWQQQPFAYLETYSFNRGPATMAQHEQLSHEIAATSEALQTARYIQQTKLQHQLRGGQYNLLLAEAASSSTATVLLVATLLVASAGASRLEALLNQAGAADVAAGCPPIFRDALVFYDAQGQYLQALNICFECLDMQAGDGQPVEANWATYEALKQLLRELGHPIADEYLHATMG